MSYTIYCCSTREPIDALPMHALVYAYRRAWRFLHGSDPQGKHVLVRLDLLIEFAGEGPERQDTRNRTERT